MSRPVTCDELDDILDAYVDGELQHVATVSEIEVAAHLTDCRSCLEHVMIVRHLKLKLARLDTAPATAESAQFVTEVVQRAQLIETAHPRIAEDPA